MVILGHFDVQKRVQIYVISASNGLKRGSKTVHGGPKAAEPFWAIWALGPSKPRRYLARGLQKGVKIALF